MEYISVGKIMEPFALKGEVKIASDFKYANKVFIKDNKIYVGDYKQELTINNVRYYKNRYYVGFNNINHINDANKYLKKIVYIERSILNLENNEYILSDIKGYRVITQDKEIGTLTDIRKINNSIEIYEITNLDKKYLIPNNKEFIKEIDKETKTIKVQLIEGMINDEN